MVFASRGAWGASGRLENESCGEIAFKYTGVIMTGNASQVIPETSDDELVRRAKSGGLEAFEALTSRYEQRVYALAMRMLRQEQDAEDVTQQTFLSVLENLEGFRGSAREIPLSGMAAGAGPPISRAEASFAAWVLRIASHAALKIIRKRKGLNTVSLEEATEGSENMNSVPHPEFIADWRQSPERLVERNEIRRLLDDALTRLDEKHRLVFLLRDVEGLSIHETAAALDLSEANVKVRLLRARLQLREELTRVLGDPERRLTRTHHQHE
jgi:RNA polymerase sigma-70 factor (ECF subfamily)